MTRAPHWCRYASFVLLPALLAAPLAAQVEPEKAPQAAQKELRSAELDIPALHLEVRQLPAAAAEQARGRLSRLGVSETSAFVDQRGGRFVTLMPSAPLIPGRGNELSWSAVRDAAPRTAMEAESAAADAFRSYLEAHRYELGIDPAELGAQRIGGHGDGELYQIYVPRTIDGIPVRDSFLTAVIGQGNLTLFGAEKWADRPAAIAESSRLAAGQARRIATEFMAPLAITGEWGKTTLEWIPVARGKAASEVALGKGYGYRLAWSVKVHIENDGGSWEVLVDALNGEILASEDKNVYAEAKGGVYPLSNDGLAPDGIEQAGWPMPFLAVTGGGGGTTDTGGNVSLTGSLTANLSGPYVRMNDTCGAIGLTQTGNLDFGASGGTDCTTPGFGGAGNTHASRSGFYELNKIKEMARGQLPANTWLTQQLTANMNINLTCNAFWNGTTVNFYRSGGGCFNTGEIAAIFDHEWGHGLDDNDVNGTIALPSGEGIADVYGALRLNDSCIGRHFQSAVCDGFGDPCLTCTGVRDIDYLKRASGTPHHFTWSNANCGGQVHCVGSVYAEAIWSLWKRKLVSAPYLLDPHTAHEVVTRLTYLAGGNIGTWFSGSPPNGGCAATSGYMSYLAADDDNGNLADGTPHMTAIWQAFNDQQIACATPTVQDSGCAGTPSVAPHVTATPGNNSVALSWAAVASATKYQVFRTEGVQGCNYGKVKLGETTGLAWNDTGLQNGRGYSYVVIPIGAHNTCMGPASSCDTVQPTSAPRPDFSLSCSPASASVQQGSSAASTCTVTGTGGYAGSVLLSCSGAPAGVSCGFSPASVSPTGASTLTVNVAPSQAPGSFGFQVVGSDGATSRNAAFSLTVTAAPTCSINADCDDGLFCNGAESCVSGSCQPGGNPCSPGQTCDEVANSCLSVPVTILLRSIGGAEDGWVREVSENLNTGGRFSEGSFGAQGIPVGDFTMDNQIKGFVSFDTSSIPDGAAVTAATLRLRRGGATGSNPFGTHGTCWVDIKTGAFGTGNAVQAGDFQAAATAAQVSSLSNAAADLDWSTGSLDAAGLAAINKTGRTQLRLYFSLDDNDDNDADVIGYYAGGYPTMANRPQLEITYLP